MSQYHTNPHTKRVLWFLRHGCRGSLEQYISSAGWVRIQDVCRLQGIERANVIAALDNRFEMQGEYIRAIEAHSIGKVREEMIYPAYTPADGELAYKAMLTECRGMWTPGSDLHPVQSRNSCFLARDCRVTSEHYGWIVVDISAMHRDGVKLYLTQKGVIVVRGSIDSKYITYNAVN